jgi:tetratricopeptide (TPR) repeat protein
VADYSEAIRLNTDYAFAYGNRARAYRSLGDLDRAIADFDQSLTLEPKNANDFNGRGVIYFDKNNTRAQLKTSTKPSAWTPSRHWR